MRLSYILVGALFIVGCATTNIKPTTVQHPAPTEMFAVFGRFEFQRVSLSSTYSGQDANLRASARIQEHFNDRVPPIILPPGDYSIKAKFKGEIKEIKNLTVPKDKRVQQGMIWDLGEP